MSAGHSPYPSRYSLNDTGWIDQAKHCPSPNFNDRPAETDISLLVIHNISLPPQEFGGSHVESFFCNRLDSSLHPYFEEICHLRVSSHLLIDRYGEVTQFVSLFDRAWHAGESCFESRPNCNDYSIGIELEGADDIPYEDAQYSVLSGLARFLTALFPKISRARIVGHSDIAPGRKTDPGPAFDWLRFNHGIDD